MAPAFTDRKLRLAARLKEGRGRAKLTQEQAAQRVGTSRRHWIRWESGETMPNSAYLARIGDVLGEDLSEFVEDEDEEEASMAPLSRDEYAMYGELTARIVAAQSRPQPAGQPSLALDQGGNL